MTSSTSSVAAKAARWLAVTAVATAVATAIALAAIRQPELTPALYENPLWLDQVLNSERVVVVERWLDEYGRENGPIIVKWEKSGEICLIGFYRRGIMHGQWTSRSESGGQITITEYRDGKVVGTWAGGDRDGNRYGHDTNQAEG